MEKRECPHFQCPVCLTKNIYKILDYFRFRDRQVWRLEKRKTEKKDFIMKHENFSSKRKGKRQYLNSSLTSDLTDKLYRYFESKVEIPRIKYGKRQTIETLINEEALLFAKYLRNERETWIPRIVVF